jgi:hypothetical protein
VATLLGPRVWPMAKPSAAFWTPADARVDAFFRFDAHYYMALALHGYGPGPAGFPTAAYRAAFFPLYPLLVKAATWLHADPSVSALVISNAAFLGALAAVYAVASRNCGPGVAAGTVWLIAFWPWSIFFSYPYSESVFLLSVAAAFLALENRRWYLAGCAGAAAALTRPTGILLAAATLVEAFVQRSRPTRLKLFAATATTAAGVFVVALLDSAAMGDPYAFWKAQGLWTAPPRNPLFPAAVLARAAVHLDFTNSQALGLPCLIAFAAAAYWVAHHLPLRYTAFVVALLAVSAWHAWTVDQFFSLPRFMATSFPSFIALPAVLEGRPRLVWVLPAWLLASAALLLVYASLYATWHFVG